MIDRRSLILLAPALVTATVVLLSTIGHAQQAFQRFFPLLIELPGWKAGKPDGAAMEMAGTSMITATRVYRRDGARLNVQVLVGTAAQGALTMIKSGLKYETSDGRMSTTTIDGLMVAQTANFKNKSGAILVAVGPNAVLNVSSEGIAEDEALALARKFDWKAIQAAVAK